VQAIERLPPEIENSPSVQTRLTGDSVSMIPSAECVCSYMKHEAPTTNALRGVACLIGRRDADSCRYLSRAASDEDREVSMDVVDGLLTGLDEKGPRTALLRE